METYLFKFSACLLVFWFVYVLLLERQKNHIFKRFYLLGTLAIAVIIPLLTITQYLEPIEITNTENAVSFLPMEPSYIQTSFEIQPFIKIEQILWIVYGIGVLLFATRFISNLYKMYQHINANAKIHRRSFVYVLLKTYRIPHSFFKYIFLHKTGFETNSIPEEVILHEETHAKQLHSLDILIIELLQIVFWFHPLIYILKHHIKLNHEFLADQAVLNNGIETKNYLNILLQFSSSTNDYQLSSAINYSSFKKRFTVMKTQTSKTRIWLSTLMLLPLIAILFYSFAEREYIEKDALEIKENLKKSNNNQLLEIDNNDPIKAYLKKYEAYKKLQDTPPHYINKTGEEQMKMETLFSALGGMYFRMSKANKSKVERPTAPILPYAKITLNGKTYFKKKSELTKEERATIPPPPPPPVKKSRGGPNVENSHEVYNHYARSIELIVIDDNSYLIDGIKATKNSFVKVFNQLHQDISPELRKNVMNIHVSSSKDISNKEVWFIYNSLKDYGFYRIVTPNQEINRAKGNTPFAIESNNSVQQKSPTKKEIASYNVWAKKIHAESKKLSSDATWYPPIDQQDLKTYSDIYNRMSVQQKKQSVEYPFPGLDTGNTEEKNSLSTESKQQIASKKQIAEYNKLAKYYNAMIREDEKVRIKMKDVEKLKYIYNLMSMKQRQNAEPFPSFPPPPEPPAPPKPPKPTVKELKEVPAPPPPPKAEEPIVFVKRMVNANAQFFSEGKSISKKEAIELVKNNPKLNIYSKKTDSKKPLVYISKKPMIKEVKEKSRN
ncbi:M56 family metallopeptidase [Winogradskyella sp. A2]|uniref:M56 family metallopeptidase n=1 Tax=Winogradskyella sp. A2 TaxID=3366944 RepID=UPI00398C4634